MSLIPYLLDEMDVFRPSRILDQHFGLTLEPEDILSPISIPTGVLRRPYGYFRPWRSLAHERDSGSMVKLDDNAFTVNLDVQQFAPNEITVKTSGDNTITVEGKHEEKQDEHGFISRHFVRKYTIPKGHDINKVASSLSSDGVLSITTPRVGGGELEHRNIPITQTGAPMKQEKKPEEKKQVTN